MISKTKKVATSYLRGSNIKLLRLAMKGQAIKIVIDRKQSFDGAKVFVFGTGDIYEIDTGLKQNQVDQKTKRINKDDAETLVKHKVAEYIDDKKSTKGNEKTKDKKKENADVVSTDTNEVKSERDLIIKEAKQLGIDLDLRLGLGKLKKQLEEEKQKMG